MTLELPLTLDRPLSRARTHFHGVLGLVCASPLPVAILLYLLGLDDPVLRGLSALQEWAAQVYLGPRTTMWGTILLLAISPIILQMGLLTYARHSHGACEVREDGATFQSAMWPGKGGKTELSWTEVESWDAERPEVVMVRKRGRSRLDRFFQPLVIPVANEEQRVGVVALLMKPQGEETPALGG